MRSQSLLLALASGPATILAHTTFTNIWIDGVSQGDGTAMRMRMEANKATYPVENLQSTDLACNVNGTKGVSQVRTVQDGATMSFEFRAHPDVPDATDHLDRGHKGPCAVYLKKVDSAIDDEGAGDGWFKIHADGYHEDSDSWCTDRLIDNGGLYNVKLPEGLLGGYYLARPEILALHNATNGDAQFYTGCAQIFLQSSGDLVPEETVSIPGYVQSGTPSTQFNIYENKNAEYVLPGPEIANLSSSGSSANVNVKAQSKQAEGEPPAGWIVNNANWFGFEVPDYSNETGCWASDKNCWDQGQACYDAAPPTGNTGCKIMEQKCQSIQDACNAKNYDGPANKGSTLYPTAETTKANVGTVIATSDGGYAVSAALAAPESSGAAVQSSAPASTSATPTQQYGEVAATPVATSSSSSTAQSSKAPASSAFSQAAPAPTAGPVCPKGWSCVTITTSVVETVTEMVTAYEKKRRGVKNRRHRHGLY